MLGWDISFYRQLDGGASPAAFDTPSGELLATWFTDGLEWIKKQAEAGVARDLGGNDYPSRYTAQVGRLLPHVRGGQPPRIRLPGENGWPHTLFKIDAMDACPPEEWLIIEIWDQS